MPPWSFVGRAAELTRLVEAANTAPGRGLIIGGIAGIGKSRLLREGIRALNADRLSIWNITAAAATSGLPLGSLAPELPPDLPAGGTSVVLLRWAVESLSRQAAGRPIVVAIDNAHLLDPLSAALIYHVARTEKATIVATVRDGEKVPDALRALWTEDLVDRIELGPLTLQETSELLSNVLGGPVDSSSVDRLWQLSQGNALLLRELVLAAESTGKIVERYGIRRWIGQIELAPSLTDVIDSQIGALTPPVRTVLELVALGEPMGLALLIRASDAESVEIAEERQLVTVTREGRRTTVRLTQPLYGEVVRHRCPVTRVRRLLATLATLVEESGARRRDDLLRVAVWRLDSDTAHDPAQLVAASRLAITTYDVALARRLAQAAMALGGGLEAANAFAETLICTGKAPQAKEILDEAKPLITHEVDRVRWLIISAINSYWGLGDETTIARIAQEARDITDPSNQSIVLAAESAMRLHHGEYSMATTLARHVLDSPASPPAPRTLAHSTMAYLHAVRGAPRQTIQAMADLDTSAPKGGPTTPYIQIAIELARGTAMILAGDLPAVDAVTTAEFAGMVNAGDFRVGSGYLAIVRAQAARLRGALTEASCAAGQAASTLQGGMMYNGLAHAERAHAAALAGHTKIAEEAMAEADRTRTSTMTVLYPWFEHARCWVKASTNQIEESLSIIERLVDRLHDDGFLAHEVIALHNYVRLDHTSESLVERLHSIAATIDVTYPSLVARQAGALLEHDGERLLSVAQSYTNLGMYLYAAEATASAITILRAERSAITPQASQFLAELRSLCQNAKTPALLIRQPVLTDRERQIARLAAVGVSSKDIAEQLYLSSRTVDNHLMRVYAKLGVTGRTELAAALGILPPEAS